jgi:antitoxin component YwqK of YwqJK toxin-antitoxin module
MKQGLYEERGYDGSIYYQAWYKDGKHHREDGSARICYHKDGSISYQTWYKDGKCHREDGPAFISYNDDGSIYYQAWYKDGKHHREDGPARICYHKDGSILYQAWYKDGREVEPFTVAAAPQVSKCTCDMSQLMISGCKCGGV